MTLSLAQQYIVTAFDLHEVATFEEAAATYRRLTSRYPRRRFSILHLGDRTPPTFTVTSFTYRRYAARVAAEKALAACAAARPKKTYRVRVVVPIPKLAREAAQ